MKYAREIKPDEHVRVHKNLNTGRWTVCAKVPGKSWQAIKSVGQITIKNAVPIVSLSGLERLRRNKSREVIAKIEGFYVDDNYNTTDTSIHFNPYRSDDFTTRTGEVFKQANKAYFPPNNAGFFYI